MTSWKASWIDEKVYPVRRVISYLFIFILLLSSCAPVRPNLGDRVGLDFANSLVSEWHQNASRIESVQGLAKVEVNAPMNDVNGTQVLIAEMPNRLRAETMTPFGVPLLTLAVDDDQLAVSLPSQNIMYLGYANSKNLGTFVNIPLDPEDLVRVLLYQPALIKSWKEEAFTLTDGGWLLVRYGTTQRQELVFDPERELSEASYFEDNDLKFKVTYSEPKSAAGGFPSRIELELPEKYATIKLELTDFETNGRIKEGVFALRPAPGTRVVYLPN